MGNGYGISAIGRVNGMRILYRRDGSNQYCFMDGKVYNPSGSYAGQINLGDSLSQVLAHIEACNEEWNTDNQPKIGSRTAPSRPIPLTDGINTDFSYNSMSLGFVNETIFTLLDGSTFTSYNLTLAKLGWTGGGGYIVKSGLDGGDYRVRGLRPDQVRAILEKFSLTFAASAFVEGAVSGNGSNKIFTFGAG